VRVLPALPEHGVGHGDGRSAYLQLDVVPGRTLAVGGRHRQRLRVTLVVRVIATGAAQVDTADEGDVPVGIAGVPDDHELLVMRPGKPDPLVEQHLPACLGHCFAEPAVLLLAVGQPVGMRAPHQPLDDHPTTGRVAEQLADRRALGAQALVGVAAPVREEQVVARTQCPDLLNEPGEVSAAVDEGHHPVPRRPRRQAEGRVAPLRGGEEPVVDTHRLSPEADHRPSRRRPTRGSGRSLTGRRDKAPTTSAIHNGLRSWRSTPAQRPLRSP